MARKMTKTRALAIARKKRRRALISTRGSSYRKIGKRRVTGAGGRKLGPEYPSSHIKSASKKAVSTNIRYFYKTRGKPLDQAIAASLSIQKRASGQTSGRPVRRSVSRKK